jgi:5-(carboxyamino)imidazole ribonucleotide mutase
MKKPLVGIIMGSQSDLKVMGKAADVLAELGVPFEISVISAHRTPELSLQYSETAIKRGLKVIIAGAGGAAHLAGVTAALTILPVIGVPMKSSNSINGLDSLLSIVQMPEGVPVASVAIDGAKNAGILAAQIIATGDPSLSRKLVTFKKNLKNKVEASAKDLKIKGYKAFMA